MRPLHRPMFRYGGPIKEGVMSGIREPHANGGRIALVGSPIFPKDASGRAHHKDYWKNLWAAGKPILKSWVTPWKKPKKVVQAGEKIVGNKNLQGIFDMTSKKATGITSSPAAQNFWKNLKSFSFPGSTRVKGWATKAKDLAVKYPKSTIVGGAYVGPKIVANVPTPKWSGSWGIKDILVPDEIYNYETGRWFNPDDTDIKPEDQKILNEKITEKVTEKIVPEVPQKSDDELRAERIQKYRDIMDIKGMNKAAAYDSLIAASKAVGESEDFKGDIKSGKLINDIIQATSKAYDKPSDMKKAIDTLILKGEIQKDIAGAKPTQYELKEDYLTGNLGAVTGKRVALGKPGTLSDALLLTKGTDTKTNRTSQALRSYFDGYLTPKFEGKLSTDNIDALGGKEKLIEGESISLDDGVYQVSKGYILVKGNKIIEQEDLFTGKD